MFLLRGRWGIFRWYILGCLGWLHLLHASTGHSSSQLASVMQSKKRSLSITLPSGRRLSFDQVSRVASTKPPLPSWSANEDMVVEYYDADFTDMFPGILLGSLLADLGHGLTAMSQRNIWNYAIVNICAMIILGFAT